MLVAGGAAACYRVPDDTCAIRCDAAASVMCPNGLDCGADNLCYAGTPCSERPGADAAPLDIPVSPDGADCYGNHLVRYCPATLPPSMEVASGATVGAGVIQLLAPSGATNGGFVFPPPV